MQPTIITIQKIRQPLFRIVKRGFILRFMTASPGLSVMLGVGEGGAQTVGAEAARDVRVFLRKHLLDSHNAASTSAELKKYQILNTPKRNKRAE